MRLLNRVSCLAVLALFLFSGLVQAQPGLDRARAVLNEHNPALFANDEVVATGISTDRDGNVLIKVYTKTDRARGIPRDLGGVTIQRRAVGIIRAGDDPIEQFKKGGNKPGGGGGVDPKTRQPRPVPIGVSIGTYRPDTSNYCFAGTLGCRLIRMNLTTGSTRHYILSNNHVLAEENGGTVGVDQVIQPGTLDNGCVLDTNDIIGELSEFQPIGFSGQTNLVDAAIAITSTSDTGFASPSEAYGAPTSNSIDATPNLAVKKFGRTTGFTRGTVDAINATVNVQYSLGVATFIDQVVIVGSGRGRNRTFSDSGDSGSLIVSDADNDPVGLLFAGSSSITIANPINAVLDSFSDPANGILFMVDDGNSP